MEHLDIVKSVILPYINFALFLIMVVLFFKKPIKNAIQKHYDNYNNVLNEAKLAWENAEVKQSELKRQLDQMSQDFDKIKEKISDDNEDFQTGGIIRKRALEDAQIEEDTIILKANKIASELIQEAERLAKTEIEKAKETIKREILLQIRERVTGKIQHEIVEEKHVQINKSSILVLKNTNLEI